MRKFVLFFVLFSIVLVGCKKSETVKPAEIPFLGTWERSFKMASDDVINVSYQISSDKIDYKGPMNMAYTIKLDTFIAKENKWIGNNNGVPYAVFVKNQSKDSITLLKMKIDSKAKGIAMPFPSKVARSKFTTWNVYTKHK